MTHFHQGPCLASISLPQIKQQLLSLLILENDQSRNDHGAEHQDEGIADGQAGIAIVELRKAQHQNDQWERQDIFQ